MAASSTVVPGQQVFESHSGSDEAKSKPLVLLLGFWGAQPRILSKYADLFNAEGHDVIMTIAPYAGVMLKLSAILRPFTVQVLEAVKARAAGRRVAIVAMSNGGCFPLEHVHRLIKERHDCVDGVKFAGVCFDSSPAKFDVRKIATAASHAAGGGAIGTVMYGLAVCLLSMAFALDAAGLLGGDSIDSFYSTMLHAPPLGPELFLFSEADTLTDYAFVEEVIAARSKLGGPDIGAVKFDGSPHVGHLRAYPEQYRTAVRGWLSKL